MDKELVDRVSRVCNAALVGKLPLPMNKLMSIRHEAMAAAAAGADDDQLVAIVQRQLSSGSE